MKITNVSKTTAISVANAKPSNKMKLTIRPVAFRVPVGDRLAVVHLDTHGHLNERKEEGEFV